MGAWMNCSFSGADAVSGTSWGFWIRQKRATAMPYSLTGSATADAVSTAAPIQTGPNPLLGGGVAVASGPWTPLDLIASGGKGSSAISHVAGMSYVNLFGQGCDISASAMATAAPGGGSASVIGGGEDPWQIRFMHKSGQKSYAMITIKPEFSLAPSRGVAGCRIYGSFGEIALSLTASDNKPKAMVKVAGGWQMYRGVMLPSVGVHFPAPTHALSAGDLEHLLLRWHDRKQPIWMTKELLTLTFVKEIPSSTAVETVKAGIEASEEEAWAGDPESDKTVIYRR